MSLTSQTALLIGATGQVGQNILKELLSSQHITKVGEFGRRVTAPESLPPQHKEKLVQKKIDFEKLDEAGLAKEKWDVVVISSVSPLTLSDLMFTKFGS